MEHINDIIIYLKSITDKYPWTEDSYIYELNGNKIMEKNHLGNTIRMLCNGINRLVEVQGCLQYNRRVVEDAIQNGTRTAGNTTGTWVYEGRDVRVVTNTNNNGGVVTVISK